MRETTDQRRVMRLALVAAIAASAMPSVARAAGSPQPLRAADGLSTPVTFTGSGDTATAVRTEELRGLVPAPSSPRIFMIGTGVARGLFPDPVTSQVAGAAGSLVDQHGYGTLAASAVLQLAGNARITSRAIRSEDSTWHLIDMSSLADALEEAFASRAAHDVVLLAFPPNGALDPFSHITGHASYPGFGQGDALLEEALLAARGDIRMRGIPLKNELRDQIFAGINDRQRDAVERYVRRVRDWNRVTRAITALSDAGVSVVSPAGDFTRTDKSGDVVPLPHQTIFGVAALPEVLTVGSAYTDNPATQIGKYRVSPTSGRGPTLRLTSKPDLVGSSDIVGMLPVSATLQWPDDSLRVPPARMNWAQAGVLPSSCPSPTRAYRCVLQASSMVSAALVATNIAAQVNRGIPNLAKARSSSDDEYLRGFAWAASDVDALTFPGTVALPDPNTNKALPAASDQVASPFEQGAGVFTGFASRDPSKLPIAMATAAIGEVGYRGSPTKLQIPVEGSFLPVPRLTHRVGPDSTGLAILRNVSGTPVTATKSSGATSLAAIPATRAGGVYAGTLRLSPSVDIPLSFVQDVPFRFHANYAYNELMGGGQQGERVEDASVILMAGLPANVGLVGEGFKVLGPPIHRPTGGDPLHNIIVRSGRANSTFRDPSLPPSEHGRGLIDAVPPGFYRFHLLTDHSVEAVQEGGTPESLGIGLGSFGPDGFTSPSSMILVASDQVCDETSADGCLEDDPLTREIDPKTGFCVARNTETNIQFGVYCGEVAYAVPGAVVTRAVHLIDRTEWKACTVGLDSNGSVTTMANLAAKGADCAPVSPASTTLTNPTGPASAPNPVGLPGASWTIENGSSNCLAPSEAATYPNGHPSDLSAKLEPLPGLINDRVPALVLTTTVPLPYLNTYTTGTLTLAYQAEGALIVTRFETRDGVTGDASHSLLTLSDVGVPGAKAKGTYRNEWAVMSANAPIARLSVIAFPTTASSARISLCDVALRVATFAKQDYGQQVAGGTAHVPNDSSTRTYPVLDRGLNSAITPDRNRQRASFDGTAFSNGTVQREDVVIATHIPRNTTASPSAERRVLSPLGGPASHAATRRWGTDGKRYEPVAERGFHDPQRGQSSLACAANLQSCQAWTAAKASNTLLDDLSPDLLVSGRFNGVAVSDRATLTAGGGNLGFDTTFARDDAGAFNSRWATAKRFSVSTFPTDASELSASNPLDPVVQVLKNASGRAVVTIKGTLPGGSAMAISKVIS